MPCTQSFITLLRGSNSIYWLFLNQFSWRASGGRHNAYFSKSLFESADCLIIE
jgi:hypothetical protein